jgi:hypothetical protein
MNRNLAGLVVALGFGYWAYTWWRDDSGDQQAQLVQDARQKDQKQAVSNMVAKASAIVDWPKSLANNKKIRTDPILTAELEDLWLVDDPVLFIGNVVDVAMNTESTYQLVVEYDRFGNEYTFVENKIRVKLNCQESFATKLISTIKADSARRNSANIAVIATISGIERTTEKGGNGNTLTVLTGIGNCVDVMQLSELFLEPLGR